MKLTIVVDDELAQENVRKLWTNDIRVSEVINKMLASLRFDFKYDYEAITIQETVTNCNQLYGNSEQPRKSRQLTTK